MATMAADKPDAPQEHLGVPSRNPLPLSASQEAQVRDIYYARVRKNCADEIKGTTYPIRSHPSTADIHHQHSLPAPSAGPSQYHSPAVPSTAP